ncbi:hypothetical protein BD324DRAFT_74013 [Kockovaella imperatae]|uniref:GAR domain-containing protein n=1 Tax=Kockovaella imperatae TaxID=4999 RepID=A0A1Y1UCG0_9TREE|nr:hypothetical protein BD324DRAFT_74013 [Kockovaella imperatae]ORX35731.1 hypothetical protein BD324DRAFT_74013 [Kockovaella imperatae]
MTGEGQTQDDELRDLSIEDATELRAFLEKRRWFETKLQVLEATPPLYPFVHPTLDTSFSSVGSGPRYVTSNGCRSHLPSADEIISWQSERDALEEEVDAFDGGDLEKMKQKTREVTSLPLTAPSTHLISITLDLIVVVDRLLTLLRRRMEVLELTSLRLKWDQLRWDILSETNQIRDEIEAIIVGKGRWKPPVARVVQSSPRPRREGRLVESQGWDPASCMTPSLSSAAIEGIASSSSTSSNLSAMTVDVTPCRMNDPDRRSSPSDVSLSTASREASTPTRVLLGLQLLHSQISNVEIRHKNLTSTLVARSGKILDKMVDVAGPLNGLGGIDGPFKHEIGGSAVPDELLDLQDEMEEQVGQASAGLAWCKALEKQWIFADAHFANSSRIGAKASQLLAGTQDALSQPTTSQKAFELEEVLGALQRDLGGDPTDLIPRPRTVDLIDVTDHSDEVLAMLKTVWLEAAQRVEACQAAIAFYRKFAESEQNLLALRDTVKDTQMSLEARSTHLAPLLDDAVRTLLLRSPNEPGLVSVCVETTGSSCEETCGFVRDLSVDARKSVQVATLAAMRHRALLKSTPESLLEETADPLSSVIANNVEDLASTLLTQIETSERQIEEATANKALLSAFDQIDRELVTLSSEVQRTTALLDSIDRNVPAEGDVDKATRTCHILQRRLQVGIGAPRQMLDTLLSQRSALSPFRQNLNRRCNTLASSIATMERMLDAFECTVQQGQILRDIEEESNTMLAQFASIEKDMDDRPGRPLIALPDLENRISQISAEVTAWESSLSKRMTWLPTSPHNSAQVKKMIRPEFPDLHLSISQLPITPPASPPLGAESLVAEDALGLLFQDRNADARQKVNEMSARVQSGLMSLTAVLSGLRDSSQHHSTGATGEDVSKDVFGLIATVVTAHLGLAKAGQSVHSIENLVTRLEGLKMDDIVRPTRAQLTINAELRRLPRSPTAKRIRSELLLLSGELDELESHPGAKTDSELRDARARLDRANADVAILDRLVAFSAATEDCDVRFSDLIDVMDREPTSLSAVSHAQTVAIRAVVRLQNAAQPVNDDLRVPPTLRRVLRTWTEIQAMAEAILYPCPILIKDKQDDMSISTSRPPSRLSMGREQGTESRLSTSRPSSSRQSGRTASSPLISTANYLSPTKSSQARSVSDSMRSSISSSRIPRARVDSMRSISSSTRAPLSTIGSPLSNFDWDPPGDPMASFSSARSTPRHSLGVNIKTSRTGAAPRPSDPKQTRYEYRADPKSELDIAVGKVMNELKVDVPIRPVGLETSDQWQDQSGKYWIGAEGRAKLCFCRILRSRTVMVRVGGGWVELSRFILEHFASHLESWQPQPVDENTRALAIGSSIPIPITATSLKTPAKASYKSLSASMTGSTRPSVARKSTPAQQAAIANQFDEIFTPRRGQADDRRDSSGGDGSPLFPL